MADQPEGSASAILATVVTEINKHKIGIPRSTADKINELLAEPELQVKSYHVLRYLLSCHVELRHRRGRAQQAHLL